MCLTVSGTGCIGSLPRRFEGVYCLRRVKNLVEWDELRFSAQAGAPYAVHTTYNTATQTGPPRPCQTWAERSPALTRLPLSQMPPRIGVTYNFAFFTWTEKPVSALHLSLKPFWLTRRSVLKHVEERKHFLRSPLRVCGSSDAPRPSRQGSLGKSTRDYISHMAPGVYVRKASGISPSSSGDF